MNIKNILGFAIGPFGASALGLIIVPVTSWMFTPEDIGRLGMFQISISFGLLFFTLGFDQAYVREFHESRDRSELLKSCFIPGFLLLSLVGFLSAPFASVFSNLLFKINNPIYYWVVYFGISITFICRFLSLILRMQERGLAFSMSQILPKALNLLLLGALAWAGLATNFLTLLCVAVSSILVVALTYLWSTRRQWRPALSAKFNAEQVITLSKFSLPLVLSGMIYWGLTATSMLLLRALSSMDELGTYSITSSFAGAATVFQSIFTVVWAPTVYKWVSQEADMSRVDAVARQALAVVCSIFVLVGSLSWLTDYLLPVHYLNVKYMVLCAIVPPLLYTLSEVTCVGIGISRRTMLTVWVTLAALVCNLLLSWWLIPTHGAAGAVIANALAYVVFFFARTEASAYAWRQFPRIKLYFFIVLVTALAITTVALGEALPFHYAWLWLALAPAVAWLFRTEWAGMVVGVRGVWLRRAVA